MNAFHLIQYINAHILKLSLQYTKTPSLQTCLLSRVQQTTIKCFFPMQRILVDLNPHSVRYSL